MNNVKKHKQSVLRDLLLAALLSLMVLPGTLHAATAKTTDSGWLAWMGCWSPKEIQKTGQENLASLCIVNSEETNELEILTIVDGSIIERRAVGLNGVPTEITSEGCDGTEAFTFSDDGRHIFLQTELLCTGGQRKETGIMTMSSPQEWLEIRAIEIGGQTIPWVLRYGVASQDVFQAAGVEETLDRSTRLARIAFTAPLTLANVVEAGTKVDPQAIEAWVLESAQPFALDGDILKRMSFSGVEPNVLDAVIAVSFPNEFVFETLGRDTEGKLEGYGLNPRTSDRITRQNSYSGNTYYGGSSHRGPFRYGYGRYVDPFGGYDPFLGYNSGYRYGYGLGYGYGYGYSPYYSSRYRNINNNYYWSGPARTNWGSYRAPTQVTGRIRTNNSFFDQLNGSRARAVTGRGYTRGGSGTPSTASPSGNPPARGGATRTAKPRGGKPPGGIS